MDRVIIAIGGGEIKNKTTLAIDEYIAALIKQRAGGGRGVATFVGVASHDSMPYFNSFRKTYTSVFDIKAEVALSVYGEMDREKIASKLEKSDCIYLGGGDTKFLIDHLTEKNLLSLIIDAYNRGVIIAGLSAGAICWFKTMYTDYDIMRGGSNEYKILDGIGILEGVACPHYDERTAEFDNIFSSNNFPFAYAIENNSAIMFKNEKLTGSLTSGGTAYKLQNNNGTITKEPIALLDNKSV